MFEALIAQVTDTHVVDPETDEELFVDNNGRLVEAVAAINAESPAPDVVLLTGDLTNWSKPVEYVVLAESLRALTMPVLVVPGNHDAREPIREHFPSLPWADGDHASWVTTVGAVRIVGLDSTIPGLPGAEFDDERAAWLESVLTRQHDGPTMLAMHHPPFTTGIEWMDNSGFVGLDRLVALLAEHPVDRIVCGHLHRPVQSSVAGIPTQVCLSTVQHVALDLTPGSPISLINDPVGYQLHGFTGSQWVSHTRYIATAEEPYTPEWADE